MTDRSNSEGCKHDWEYFEDEENRPYTGYLERCKRCGTVVQVPQ